MMLSLQLEHLYAQLIQMILDKMGTSVHGIACALYPLISKYDIGNLLFYIFEYPLWAIFFTQAERFVTF